MKAGRSRKIFFILFRSDECWTGQTHHVSLRFKLFWTFWNSGRQVYLRAIRGRPPKSSYSILREIRQRYSDIVYSQKHLLEWAPHTTQLTFPRGHLCSEQQQYLRFSYGSKQTLKNSKTGSSHSIRVSTLPALIFNITNTPPP